MTIEKKLKDLGKKAVVGTALLSVLAFGACERNSGGSPPPASPTPVPTEPAPTPTPPTDPVYPPYPNPSPVPIPNDTNPGSNDAPVATIIRDFRNGLSGNVDYTFCGADPDLEDSINYLDTEANASPLRYTSPGQYNPYCETKSVPIRSGYNYAQLTASDNNGLDGITVMEDFDSPTEAEARSKIEEILDARLANNEFQSYEIDRILSVGGVHVMSDYKIIRKDDGLAYINFVNHSSEDLTEQISNKELLNGSGIANRYMVYLPLDKIEEGVNEFLDNCVLNNNYVPSICH